MTRSLMLLLLVFAETDTTTLQAQCGWVLWQSLERMETPRAASADPTKWSAIEGFESLADCRQDAAARVTRVGKDKKIGEFKTIEVTDRSVVLFTDKVVITISFACLPSGTDPRPR